MPGSGLLRRLYTVSAFLLLHIAAGASAAGHRDDSHNTSPLATTPSQSAPIVVESRMEPRHLYRSRRLLLGTANRISDQCTKSDISIFQGRSSPLPNGIPTYTVQIVNMCVVGCPLSNIHVSCGWFASAKLVSPRVFRRLGFNDCLVNDGKPVRGGESIFFHYANSFQYPMRVLSASCSGV